MNLFILSLLPIECAQYMFDKHIVKIILEAVQMLCTCKILLDSNYTKDGKSINEDDIDIYKATHVNHPVNKWVRESYENWCWTLELCDAMHDEWKFRYNHPKNKFHKSYLIALFLRENPPSLDKFPKKGLTDFKLAMPEEYKSSDPVESYKKYYMSSDKQKIASWKKRSKPDWYKICKV